MFEARVYDTTVNQIAVDVFMDVLETDVLPKMNSFPMPNSVLILDNAPPHQKHCIEAACVASGVLILYLPPYSYDFNPIELMFHLAKRLMRQRYNDTDAGGVGGGAGILPEQYEECLHECVTPHIACNLFAHRGHFVRQEIRDWACRPR